MSSDGVSAGVDGDLGKGEVAQKRSRITGAAVLPARNPTSWDDDPFLDSLELEETSRRDAASSAKAAPMAAQSHKSVTALENSAVPEHMSGSARIARSDRGGGAVGCGNGAETGSKGRRHTTPLTSISALFGGGSNGGTTRAVKPKAGTKRPRPLSSASYPGRMKPPLPSPASGLIVQTTSSIFNAFSGFDTAKVKPQQKRLITRNRSGQTSNHSKHKATSSGQQSDHRDHKTNLSDERIRDNEQGSNILDNDYSDDGIEFLGVKRHDASSAAVGVGTGLGHSRRRGQAAGPGGRGLRAEGRRVEDELWPDKHRPRDVSKLAVHVKKVEEVRHWMTLALNARPGSGTYRLLALVGPPGSAKSTMVRLLAEDMGVNLAEWQDTAGQGGAAYRPRADGPALATNRSRHELGSSYQSSLDSFEEFMRRSSYRSLPMLASTSARRAGPAQGVSGDKGGRGEVTGSIVLIEELPMAHGEEKQARLQRLMAECARSSPSPIVLVWSQASEHSSYQSQLEQALSRETLRMPGVQITTVNPINATLLRQHLRNVLTLEDVSDPRGALVEGAVATCRGDIRHALLSLQMLVGGRNSSTTTLHANGNNKSTRSGRGKRIGTKKSTLSSSSSKTPATGTDSSSDASSRDTFLSQFHALGKLLYAKRSASSSKGGGTRGSKGRGAGAAAAAAAAGGRGELGFVPEDVLAQGNMSLDWALAFLQYHCVDFYTDEDDLAEGLGYMSDADIFASRMYDSSKGSTGEESVFPQRYAESIVSRATAYTNRHPAKSRMRSFGAPKSFEMRRNQAEAKDALRKFVGDAWDASGGDLSALWASSRHPQEAVDTELLPTARLITGEWHSDAALRSLLQRFMSSKQQQQQQQQQHNFASKKNETQLPLGNPARIDKSAISTHGENASSRLTGDGSNASPIVEPGADARSCSPPLNGGATRKSALIGQATNTSTLTGHITKNSKLIGRSGGVVGITTDKKSLGSITEDNDVLLVGVGEGVGEAVCNGNELEDDIIGEF